MVVLVVSLVLNFALFAFARSILKGKKLKKATLEDYFMTSLIDRKHLLHHPGSPLGPET